MRGLLLQPYCNPLAQRLLQSPSGTLLHIREYMGVGVEGYGDGSMSQHLRDDLGVYVSRQEQRRAGMPEVVKPDGRKSGHLEERLEGPLPEVGRVHQRPSLGS